MANVATAVTPLLARALQGMRPHDTVHVLTNGCDVFTPGTPVEPPQRRGAALLGQLNERLDLTLLDELAASGVHIDVIGPRRELSSATAKRLDNFFGNANVRWLGEVSADEVPLLLARTKVGITPYVIDEFNRASFPLKILEYLAAGLTVVATDLPAVRSLHTDAIKVGTTRGEFISHVIHQVQQDHDKDQESENRAFVRQHTWNVRAEQLRSLADAVCADHTSTGNGLWRGRPRPQVGTGTYDNTKSNAKESDSGADSGPKWP
ncbi:glycosyltransferase [Pseudarthrobacter sp. NPDC058119]|uniref:glycosyltransferase n=1 Tax=Pseudarthrobacter sp. NPDC058119 TaxID=3346348 RepID=UPI0036DAC7A0